MAKLNRRKVFADIETVRAGFCKQFHACAERAVDVYERYNMPEGVSGALAMVSRDITGIAPGREGQFIADFCIANMSKVEKLGDAELAGLMALYGSSISVKPSVRGARK